MKLVPHESEHCKVYAGLTFSPGPLIPESKKETFFLVQRDATWKVKGSKLSHRSIERFFSNPAHKLNLETRKSEGSLEGGRKSFID